MFCHFLGVYEAISKNGASDIVIKCLVLNING